MFTAGKNRKRNHNCCEYNRTGNIPARARAVCNTGSGYKGRIAINQITGLGRPLVFSHVTNRLIVLLSLVVLVLIFIYQVTLGEAFLEALGSAGAAAFAFFLSWAISREIDPYHDWAAFPALPFTLGAVVLYGSPALATLLFILLLSRMLNLSTGHRTTVLDALLLIILGAILFISGFVIALPILAAAFWLDSILFEASPVNRRHIYFAILSLGLFAAMVPFYYPQLDYRPGFDLYTGSAVLVLALSAGILMARAGTRRIAGDNGKELLDTRRVRLAQVTVALFVVVEIFLRGSIALTMLYPAFFACMGTAIYNLFRRPDPDG